MYYLLALGVLLGVLRVIVTQSDGLMVAFIHLVETYNKLKKTLKK